MKVQIIGLCGSNSGFLKKVTEKFQCHTEIFQSEKIVKNGKTEIFQCGTIKNGKTEIFQCGTEKFQSKKFALGKRVN